MYDTLVKQWISECYTICYLVGMAPDVYHMFAKSDEVFSNVYLEKAQAQLCLLYEVTAMGFLVECAGGSTTHEFEDKSMLDLEIDDLDKRLGVCFRGGLTPHPQRQQAPMASISQNLEWGNPLQESLRIS